MFELISTRHERRSLLITANQPFGEWGKVFQDPAMTLAAVDRLVHHATIFEMNVESYRRRAALARKKPGPGRTANYATIENVAALSQVELWFSEIELDVIARGVFTWVSGTVRLSAAKQTISGEGS